MVEYRHLQIGKEVRFLHGFYEVEKENVIKHRGRDLLVVIGHAILDNSCCGLSGLRYALVPGYILKWKYRSDENGHISQVEPVHEDDKEEIEEKLKSTEIISQVIFW